MAAQQRPGPKPRQHPDGPIYSEPGKVAQQRPGPKPRQHQSNNNQWQVELERSTKAGTEAPATQAGALPDCASPRRSTKAGTEAPATRPASIDAAPVGRRSTKAGTEAPATLLDLPPVRWYAPSLNKGRDRSPGNTPWAAWD